MDDFDILYMMKTPLYMGSLSKVAEEAQSCDVNEDDQANLTSKNLLVVRALTAMNDFDQLKSFMQGLVAGETP